MDAGLKKKIKGDFGWIRKRYEQAVEKKEVAIHIFLQNSLFNVDKNFFKFSILYNL